MKTFSCGLSLLLMLCLFSSCERNIAVETVVHPDGRIDRTIVIEEADSSEIGQNIFGVCRDDGWEVDVEKKDAHDDLVLQFRKSFSSAEAANREMNTEADTLFRIESRFQKKFRWFYTYLEYADVYKAVDRFRYVSSGDFFTQEDHAFIDRLPAEGTAISKADSVYLLYLNNKIFEHYAARGFFEESYRVFEEVMKKHNIAARWFDTLAHHKENLYRAIMEEKSDLNELNAEDFRHIADSLHIPLPYEGAVHDFRTLKKARFAGRENFMKMANVGKYSHVIEMPWTIIRTNADSTAGPRVYWHPPVMKFLLKDYVMSAEARKMNYWAVIVSAVVVLFSIFILARAGARKRASKASAA